MMIWPAVVGLAQSYILTSFAYEAYRACIIDSKLSHKTYRHWSSEGFSVVQSVHYRQRLVAQDLQTLVF